MHNRKLSTSPAPLPALNRHKQAVWRDDVHVLGRPSIENLPGIDITSLRARRRADGPEELDAVLRQVQNPESIPEVVRPEAGLDLAPLSVHQRQPGLERGRIVVHDKVFHPGGGGGPTVEASKLMKAKSDMIM